MPALRMNKMLSTDYLGTQELHSFCKTTEILEDSQCEEIAFDRTAVGSTLLSHQNVCSTSEVPGANFGITEVSFSQDEFNTTTTGVLPPSLLSCGPRSMLPISVPSSSSLETILSPDPTYSELQVKEMNHNATAMDESSEFLQLILSSNDEGYNTANEFQVWDVLDFYFSESFSAMQFDSLMGFTNDVSSSHHECMNLVDMVERPVALLSLNDTEEQSNTTDEAHVDHTIMDPDDTSLYLQMKPSDLETESNCASQDLEKPLSRGLPDLMDVDSPSRLSKSARSKQVTLVLDLDETLVHSTLDHCDDADFTLQVFFNMKNHTVYVRQRPHLKMFLEKAAQMFELVIFTASQRIYAEQLIDRLDPDGRLISNRIYRESCIFSDGCYTKDLTILGVDLAKVMIVDNTPQVFQLQVDNGIPIKSWFDDPSDQELVELLPFLETLVGVDDVRPIISRTFHHTLEQN
ncbi:CTD small phosphatase-like protein 2 isoform X2 [Oryza brachyantha]|uniref:FCP1 homology domain-containing protein n=1 Tax=Oryza brachyantha TaxID=4533 RepID=J3L238_ORYBR|nr:CTD small phosphatase-like protein 2 isoform X2 [Oryza brachyantha]